MGSLSIWHILILVIVAVLLFGGRGKISDLMGDVAKGIKSFRHGLNEPDDTHTISPDRREDAPVKKDQTVGR
ncbi:MAG: twin-arginine translocase TatA/TatE family subunit [Rhizomicrobium sp.]|jgi:sec-independent protein translocase protein TatA